MGPKMWGMLVYFWERHELVTQQNSYHGPQFRATRGTTHGVMTSPILSNVDVGSMVCHWLSITVEDDAVIHVVLGYAVVRILGGFLRGLWYP